LLPASTVEVVDAQDASIARVRQPVHGRRKALERTTVAGSASADASAA